MPPRLRRDKVLGRWVVVAEERAKRPIGGGKETCPFCPGHEHLTPPAILALTKHGDRVVEERDEGDSRVKDWLVRCFENLYPAFKPPSEAPRVKGLATGRHEVLVETPIHDEHPHVARLEQLKLALKALLLRMEQLSSEDYVEYVAVFRNYGRLAGASIPHPHTQIVALPFIPDVVKLELKSFKAKCPICSRSDKLTFYDDGEFVAFLPRTGVSPYEFWLAPRTHEPTLSSLNLEGLARALRSTLSSLAKVLDDPPYNMWLHVAPIKESPSHYHWHFEVRPKVTIQAGLEQGFWVYVNPTPPEKAARRLRATASKG
ncbi:MAG: hypothetical protein DRJ97_02800 [Thermoprotei archaeon]|nr:MAG: hypothetical protein DRJ97_02800 [Thermoprotei archaeon]